MKFSLSLSPVGLALLLLAILVGVGTIDIPALIEVLKAYFGNSHA